MRLGQAALEALRTEITGALTIGQELVVTKWIALGGTGILVQENQERLRTYFSRGFLREAEDLGSFTSVEKEWEISESFAGARYTLGEGGILAGLWKMAEAADVGLHVDLRKIPVRQETIEVCERLDVNPYLLQSEGSLLVGTDRGSALVEALQEQGISASVIGYACEGRGRILYNDGHVRYLDRPQPDELKRVRQKSP